ncbi:MAG: F0F1 ATP synthase subunit A [Acidimicrobiales bacterium]
MNLTPSILAIDVNVGTHPTFKIAGLSVNLDDLVSVCVAGLVIVVLGLLLRRKITAGVPGKFQLAFETIVGAVEDQVRSSMGDAGMFIVPLAVAIFLFILLSNWIELIPTTWPGHDQLLPAPTGDINETLALAILVIVLVHVTWIQKNGIKRYIGHYFKPYPALFPLVVIEEITKPVSLGLRLFGNILAGGIMLELIAGLPISPKDLYGLPIPILDIVWKLFDVIFIGFVQAFIFSLLTLLYFSAAVTGDH